jgi:acetamidase/formamidase
MVETAKIEANAKTVKWGFHDAASEPVLSVESGATVSIDTLTGEPWDMPAEELGMTILPEQADVHQNADRGQGPHMVTGPVHVKGAMPGDVLQVDILDITVRQSWGWSLIQPLLGTLPEDFHEKRHFHCPIDITANTVTLPWGKALALKPFFGILAVAPPPNWGRITSIIPRDHGGNMDNKELIAGTTVYFPVFNEGAMFSAGDGHGVQGDGEVCLTAVETALTGTFKLTVRKDLAFPLPRAETDDWIMTMGFHEDLDDAVKIALRAMIDWIVDLKGLSREEAYLLCSLTADLRVTQTVDVNKGIHCMLPKEALT